MLVVPDPETAMIDPFIEMHTLAMICNIHDPITKRRLYHATRATSPAKRKPT